MKKASVIASIFRDNVFIFRSKILDFFVIVLSIISTSLFIILGHLKILQTVMDSMTILVTELENNTSAIHYATKSFELIARDHSVSIFLYLTPILLIFVFIFSRHSPRKTGLIFIYMAIRTPIHLLITAADLKFNTMGLWSGMTGYEAPFAYQIIFSKTYLILLEIACCLLIIQGLILLIAPKSCFDIERKITFLFNERTNIWIKNIIALIPVTLFIVAEGNFLIFYLLSLLNNELQFQMLLSPLYLTITSLIILLLILMFNTIQEPSLQKQKNMVKKRLNLLLIILVCIIWWIGLFYYGLLFWTEGHIDIEVIRSLFLVICIPFVISYCFYCLILFYQKGYFKIIKRSKSQEDIRITKRNEKNNIKRLKFIQICKTFTIIILLSSPIFTIGKFVELDNYFSLDANFGLNMRVERNCFVNKATFFQDGFFNLTIEIDVNFTNVPKEIQGSLISMDSFVMDTNNDTLYDSYFYFYNISASNISHSGVVIIGSYLNRSMILINGDGIYEIAGFVNGSFFVGEQITFLFANSHTDEIFSIVFSPYTTTILSN